MINEETMGNIKCSDDVLAICAMNAALRTTGVADLSAGLTETISKNLLGKPALYKGIKVSQDEKEVQIDIHLIVRMGVKIPEVAWNVQENVKKEIETIAGTKVKAVNIFVQGVSSEEV